MSYASRQDLEWAESAFAHRAYRIERALLRLRDWRKADRKALEELTTRVALLEERLAERLIDGREPT